MEDLNSSTENISTLSQLLKELDEKKKKINQVNLLL